MWKLPNRKDHVPSFPEMYQKTFKSPIVFEGRRWNNYQEAEEDQEKDVRGGLPSKELRALLLSGEHDRRHEFEEIIRDFPKIDDQK